MICAAAEYAGGTESQAFAAIEDKIGRNTAEVLERAGRDGRRPRAAAEAMARERVEAAMRYTRFD